jgi:cytoskeletal protein RodZ
MAHNHEVPGSSPGPATKKKVSAYGWGFFLCKKPKRSLSLKHINKLKNQSGFSAVEALLVLIVIGILGFTGWFVYHAKQTSDKNYSTANSSKTPTYKDKKTTSSTDPTQGKLSSYTLSSVSASFSYPSGWNSLFTYPNGIALKSPDFQSAGGFSKISTGTAVTVSYNDNSVDSDSNVSLTTQAASIANGTPASSKFITVADLNAIEFSHSSGENRNQHLDVLFMKNGKQYLIDQQFNLNSQNPYPNLVSGVASSFKFTN